MKESQEQEEEVLNLKAHTMVVRTRSPTIELKLSCLEFFNLTGVCCLEFLDLTGVYMYI